MRRGSSTVVALVGDIDDDMLRTVARATNVALIRVERQEAEAAVAALGRAQGTGVPYVVVAADPLADVAGEWHALWNVHVAQDEFEVAAGAAISAWRAERFELPDYYLVVASDAGTAAAPHRQDFHLGFLKSERPARVVAVAASGVAAEDGARVISALGHLPQGPWWPPLDRLIDRAKNFFPASVATSGQRIENSSISR